MDLIRCSVCGRFFEDDDPAIVDCEVCLRFVCWDCEDSPIHEKIDREALESEFKI